MTEATFDVLAPGKLVLMGEYAVLDGAPAISLAITRGVRCAVRPGAGLVTPDGDDRYAAAAVRDATSARFEFSDWNPTDLPVKPGFGGSAAAVVAGVLASGRAPTDAYAVHRAVQGSGSGIDVATSLHGGMIRFDLAPNPEDPPLVRSLRPVVPLVIWSGKAAQTGPRIAAYKAWRGRDEFVDASAELCDQFPVRPVEAMAEAGRRLAAMAQAARVDYLTPTITEVMRLAWRCGGGAKPSGAGGGDCLVALLPSPDATAAFLRHMARLKLTVIPVSVSGAASVVAPGATRLPG